LSIARRIYACCNSVQRNTSVNDEGRGPSEAKNCSPDATIHQRLHRNAGRCRSRAFIAKICRAIERVVMRLFAERAAATKI
jgi:hypothetical protein